jgi:hypothetical protein
LSVSRLIVPKGDALKTADRHDHLLRLIHGDNPGEDGLDYRQTAKPFQQACS